MVCFINDDDVGKFGDALKPFGKISPAAEVGVAKHG